MGNRIPFQRPRILTAPAMNGHAKGTAALGNEIIALELKQLRVELARERQSATHALLALGMLVQAQGQAGGAWQVGAMKDFHAHFLVTMQMGALHEKNETTGEVREIPALLVDVKARPEKPLVEVPR